MTGGQVTVKQTDNAIEIFLPVGDRRELDTIIALELDRPAGDIEPLDVRNPASLSLATAKKATASNVFQNSASYGADKAFDDVDETRWATDPGTTNAWLEVDLGKPETVNRAV
ncbi:MAG: discoidin domain-containing protein, partial [Verrucomicrobiota bacterium]